MPRVSVNGIDVYYERMGEGPALILLHGNGESGRIFSSHAETFSKAGFTVYTPDTRGQGRSGWNGGEFSYGQFADDLAAFIEALGIGKAALLGFSDGGITALITAYKYPDKVSRLIAAGANTTVAGQKRGFVRLIKVIRRIFKLFGAERLAALYNLMITDTEATDDKLAKITCPALIVAGGRDLIKTEHSYHIASAIKGARLMIYEKSDHFTVKRARFKDDALSFLKERG